MARVKQIRQAHALTQEQFAERAGLDYKYYQHVEAGRRPNLGMETLLKIAKGAGLELWELLNFEREPAVLAEDRPEGQARTGEGKGGRKARKRQASGKDT